MLKFVKNVVTVENLGIDAQDLKQFNCPSEVWEEIIDNPPTPPMENPWTISADGRTVSLKPGEYELYSEDSKVWQTVTIQNYTITNYGLDNVAFAATVNNKVYASSKCYIYTEDRNRCLIPGIAYWYPTSSSLIQYGTMLDSTEKGQKYAEQFGWFVFGDDGEVASWSPVYVEVHVVAKHPDPWLTVVCDTSTPRYSVTLKAGEYDVNPTRIGSAITLSSDIVANGNPTDDWYQYYGSSSAGELQVKLDKPDTWTLDALESWRVYCSQFSSECDTYAEFQVSGVIDWYKTKVTGSGWTDLTPLLQQVIADGHGKKVIPSSVRYSTYQKGMEPVYANRYIMTYPSNTHIYNEFKFKTTAQIYDKPIEIEWSNPCDLSKAQSSLEIYDSNGVPVWSIPLEGSGTAYTYYGRTTIPSNTIPLGGAVRFCGILTAERSGSSAYYIGTCRSEAHAYKVGSYSYRPGLSMEDWGMLMISIFRSTSDYMGGYLNIINDATRGTYIESYTEQPEYEVLQ